MPTLKPNFSYQLVNAYITDTNVKVTEPSTAWDQSIAVAQTSSNTNISANGTYIEYKSHYQILYTDPTGNSEISNNTFIIADYILAHHDNTNTEILLAESAPQYFL